jgi:glycine cleavage system aminomethyltransferase T
MLTIYSFPCLVPTINPPNPLRLLPIRIGSNQAICTESVHEDVTLEVLEGWGLLAVRGPRASQVLQSLVTNIDLQKELTLGHSVRIDFPALGEKGKLHIARGRYTGEDGFKVSDICPAPCRQ